MRYVTKSVLNIRSCRYIIFNTGVPVYIVTVVFFFVFFVVKPLNEENLEVHANLDMIEAISDKISL